MVFIKINIPKIFQKTQKRSIAEDENMIQADGAFTFFNNNGYINREKALNIPSVTACVEFISSAIAGLPITLYRESDGGTQAVADDVRVYCLNSNTGDTLDSFQLKKRMVIDYLLSGKAFIYINKDKGKVKSLHYVDCGSVSYFKNQDAIFKSGYYLINGIKYFDFNFVKMLRNTKDGIIGYGITEENKDILLTAYNTLKYEQELLQNAGVKKGIVTFTDKVSSDDIKQLQSKGKDLLQSKDAIMFLNQGADFKQLSTTAVENQLNENKNSNAEEICKIFGLSADVISGKATDEQYTNAIKTAVIPIITAFETALNNSLLLENEKSNYYFSFDVRQLLKGDILKRYQAYQIGLNSNFLQPDEVRYFEDLEPLGLDFIKLGLNDVLYNVKSKEIYTPNTGKTKNINSTSDITDSNSADIDDTDSNSTDIDNTAIDNNNTEIPKVDKDETISEVSLNGAQIASLLSIVQAVSAGELQRDSAITLITSAFPFNMEVADKILGNPNILHNQNNVERGDNNDED